MKRFFSLIIVVAMVCTLFTACSKKVEETPDTTEKMEDTSTVEAQETKSEEPAWKTKEVSITLWDGVPEDLSFEKDRERFKRFDDAYPNIKVKRILWQPEPGQDRLEYVTAMAGGTGPSAFFNNYPALIQNYIKQGFCAPLDGYVDNWVEKDNLRAETLELAKKDGILYGLPGEAGILVFAYNKNMFKKAGLDPNKPPRTWDDVVEFGKILTNEEAGEYGNLLLGGGGIADWWFMFYVWQAGGNITKVQDDGTVTLHLTDGPAETALQFYQDMKFVHKITEKDTLKGFGDLCADFAQQKAAMSIMDPGWIGWWVTMGLDTEQLGLVSMPAGPSGRNTTSFGTTYYTINALADKDEQDAAWEYLKYIKLNRDEMIQDIKDKAEQNVSWPRILPFKDLNVSDYTTVDPEWEKAVSDAIADSRQEYFLVESIRPYLSPAIEGALADPEADVKKILADVQEVIQKEVIDPYNAEIGK